MTIYQMRDRVKLAYPNKYWASRVDKMSDAQILAIYNSLVKRGRIK